MPQPQPPRGFHVGSAVSGFAIGAVVTLLATIAVIPGGSNRETNVDTTSSNAAGDESYGEGAGEELLEDDALAAGSSGGSTGGSRTGPGRSGAGAAKGSSAAGGATAGGTGTGGSAGRAGGGSGSGSAIGGGGAGTGGAGSAGGGGSGGNCSGGATATGVTATEVKLGATIAESGIAKSFLGEVRQGMEAQVKKVNRSGGICGRQLKIVYKDDGWEASRGAEFIKNLVEGEKVFALAVSPSSEGLNQASNQGYFQQQGVPVVGADGLNATQFKDPLIWPVAAATTTTIDVMMRNAADRAEAANQKLRPAIVFGNTYRFGVEGAFAANAAYRKITGEDIPGYKNPLTAGGGGCAERFCGVSAGQGQYGNQVSLVKQACETGTTRCNFMILLLEPKTAQDWMAVPGVQEPKAFDFRMAGPQPLFTYDFGRNCGDKCNEMWLWTGYNPPIDRYKSSGPVNGYVSDLKAQSGAADEFNQFTMGGYIGMQLLIEALKQVGGDLTRPALVAKLNSMAPLETGLSTPLAWRPNARYANHSAQAFRIEAKNGFSGWSLVQEPIRDPWLGQHTG